MRDISQLLYHLAACIITLLIQRILAKHYKPIYPGGPSWLIFLGQAKDSLWSIDLFRCESIHLRSHWVMLAVYIHTRRIAGFAAYAGDVNGIIACRLLNQILRGRSPPARVSTDHDPIFKYHRWQANLRVLDIEEVKTVPYTPLSHPFVEGTTGTVRREFLDRTLFWNETDLSNKLAQYKTYYNEFRGHLSVGGKTPVQIAEKACVSQHPIRNYSWVSHCNGLFHTPMASQC